MTNEELVKVIREERRSGCLEELYIQNIGMIKQIARRFEGLAEFDDLVQEGFFGLVKAIDHYEENGGANFATYARYWIEHVMRIYIHNKGTPIRIPIGQKEQILKYKRTVENFKKEKGRAPKNIELASLLRLTTSQIYRLKKDALLLESRSFSEIIGEDITLEDTLAIEDDNLSQVEDEVQNEELASLLWSLVDELEEKESQVLKKRYKENKTLENCGNDLGVTKEKIRRIERRALSNMRHKKRFLLPFIEDILIIESYQGTGLGYFNRTWTSSPERAVILKEKIGG